MIRNRIAATDCNSWLSYLNPVSNAECLFSGSTTLPAPTDDSAACAQAAGGTTTSALYQQCMIRTAQVATDMATSQPGPALDYTDVMTGNAPDLANPFTGTGPLAPSSSGIPTWAWIAGAGVLGALLLIPRGGR